MAKLSGASKNFYVTNGEAGELTLPGDSIAINLTGNVAGSITEGDITVTTITTTGNVTIGGDSELDGALNHDGTTVGFYGTTPTTQAVNTTDLKGVLEGVGLIATPSGASPLDLDGGAATVGTLTVEGVTVDLTAGPADVVLDTTTGTKIGTATSQKLAFYNSTPVIQQSSTGEATGFVAGAGTPVLDDSTFTGNVGSTAYRISDIVKHLKTLGLIAA